MKKTKLSKGILAIGMMVTALAGVTQIQAYDPIVRIVVNGEPVSASDATAFTDKNSRTMIPIRFVSEQLGAKVEWNKQTQEVVVSQADKIIKLKIGEKQVSLNGTAKQLDTAAVVKEGRTYIPLRFVGEALGAQVQWDPKGRTAYINNNGEPIVKDDVLTTIRGFVIPVTKETRVRDKGSSYFITTETELVIFMSKEEDPDDKDNKCIMSLQANVNSPTYKDQLEEIEHILSQKISSQTISKIKAQIAKKTDMLVNIGSTYFDDGRFKVRVDGYTYEINIQVDFK
jgi:hypothetical protein